MLDRKVIFGKPVFETEELFVREQLVLEIKDSRKRRVVHIDKEFMANEMKLKYFDFIFDCQNFFIDHMVILFSFFELSACMRTEMRHAIYFFKKNGTSVIIVGISLEDALPSCGNSECRR